MKDDLYNSATVGVLLAPIAATTTQTGTGVDLTGYMGRLKVIQSVGAVTGTTPTLNGKIQDSADNSSFADLATPIAFSQVTATGQSELAVDPRAVRRYIRYVGTIAGTTPVFPTSVQFVGYTQVK